MAGGGHSIFCLVSGERSGQRAAREEADQSFRRFFLCDALSPSVSRTGGTCVNPAGFGL